MFKLRRGCRRPVDAATWSALGVMIARAGDGSG
jgi:hypothetical protein